MLVYTKRYRKNIMKLIDLFSSSRAYQSSLDFPPQLYFYEIYN